MGYGGKLWNVGFDFDRFGASDTQLRHLRRLYGKDFRGKGLTSGEAYRMITEGWDRMATEKVGLSDLADQLITVLMKDAVEAANLAAEKWLEAHPEPHFFVQTQDGRVGVHGFVGHAYLTAPKKGSSLAKWIREHHLDDRRNLKVMPLHHAYANRLEGELQLAACVAALDVLREHSTETSDMRVVFHCDRDEYEYAA